MNKDCAYISLSSLKDRGWTESIIKRYALQHDKEAVNPYYRSAAPIKLYELHKIEAIEATEEFKELQSATLKRKEAAKKAAETKLQAMKDYVHSIEILLLKAMALTMASPELRITLAVTPSVMPKARIQTPVTTSISWVR